MAQGPEAAEENAQGRGQRRGTRAPTACSGRTSAPSVTARPDAGQQDPAEAVTWRTHGRTARGHRRAAAPEGQAGLASAGPQDEVPQTAIKPPKTSSGAGEKV